MIKGSKIKRKFLSLFNRDTDYWNSYYKKFPPESQTESLFACFISKYLFKGGTIVDLGCGNGRDSFFFNKNGLNVWGIDASESVINALNRYASDNMHFVCGNFITDQSIFSRKVDFFYSRFTLHAIDKKGESVLLKNVFSSLADNGMFFVEVRGIHDEKYGLGEKVDRNAFLLDGHYRRFIDINELLKNLIKTGFSIKYAEEERGFAPYKDEDSEIIRVIAVK